MPSIRGLGMPCNIKLSDDEDDNKMLVCLSRSRSSSHLVHKEKKVNDADYSGGRMLCIKLVPCKMSLIASVARESSYLVWPSCVAP
jgi:hypothetical protein